MKDLLTTIQLQEERKKIVENAYRQRRLSREDMLRNIAEANAIIKGTSLKIQKLDNTIQS